MSESSLDLVHVQDKGPLWVLRCPPRKTDMAKQIPGLRYDRKLDAWAGPPTLAAALAIRGIFGEDIDVSDRAYAHVANLNEQNERRFEILKVERAEHFREVFKVGDMLFDFQVGSSILMSADWFLNCDDRGNGKTPQGVKALELALADHGGTGLFITTKSMLYTVANEIRKFSDLTPFVLDGTAPKRVKLIEEARNTPGAVMVVTWTSMTKHTMLAHYGSKKRTEEQTLPKELNGGWVTVVVADEAHKAKSPAAQQTRGLWAIGDEAKVRAAMTATPITDDALDLWAILRFLSPESFPSKSKYRDRYVLTYEAGWGGTEVLGFNPITRPELDRIILPHWVRRPLQNDVKALPPQVRWLDMTPKQAKAYKAMKKRMVAEVDGAILSATDALTRDTRLQQIAAATPVVEEYTDEEGNERARVVALEEPSCKVDALIELIEETSLEDNPLVVFAESRKLIELFYNVLTLADGRTAKRGRLVLPQERVGLITGQVSGIEREHHVNAFQAGEEDIILCTIGAGSEGITLTRSNLMAFFQRSWKMIGNLQAEGRTLRLGQERDVQTIDFITKGTVEERVHEAHDRKEGNLQELVRDEGWVLRAILDA